MVNLPESALPSGPGIFIKTVSAPRPMTADEARACVGRINSQINDARSLLLELYEREGWKALGYPSWRQCVEQEFQQSKTNLYRQLEAAKIERELNSPAGELPERQLRGLSIESVRQAKAELKSEEPHYEHHEDAEPELKITPPEPVARGAKEIIAKAKELKAKQKEQKREARRADLDGKAEVQPARASVGSVEIHCADSRRLGEFVKPGSVQLVVTSPPYNVGMPYREHNDDLSDSDYAALLQCVFSECFTAMCDGARIAVVVPFGIGRHPWKPVAAVVADHLCAVGFTLRGQIVWHKGTFDTSTAWGTYRSPASPILRDTNECVVVAQKGMDSLDVPNSIFDVDEVGKHSPWLKSKEDFMHLVTDYWPISPDSAERVGHPAPFPVELASRLIRLYAYPGAMVVDPFAGSGTVGVAAIQLGCTAILSEIDAAYCALAQERCNTALKDKDVIGKTPAEKKPKDRSKVLNAPGWTKEAQNAVAARANGRKK